MTASPTHPCCVHLLCAITLCQVERCTRGHLATPQNPPDNNFPLWRGEKPLEVKNSSIGRKNSQLEVLRSIHHLYKNSLPKLPRKAAFNPSEGTKTTPSGGSHIPLEGRAPLWRRVVSRLEETKKYLAGGILGVAKCPGVKHCTG